MLQYAQRHWGSKERVVIDDCIVKQYNNIKMN